MIFHPVAEAVIVYEYKGPLHTATRTLPVVTKASRAEVERFIQLHEFGPLFGGYVLWHAPEPPTPEMPGPALGVWGRRNASKFRRILRERGASVELVTG